MVTGGEMEGTAGLRQTDNGLGRCPPQVKNACKCPNKGFEGMCRRCDSDSTESHTAKYAPAVGQQPIANFATGKQPGAMQRKRMDINCYQTTASLDINCSR